MSADPGLDLVEHLRGVFAPEPPWLASEPRGFTWWPHHAPQRVWAEPARTMGGIAVFRVCAESALLAGVHGSGPQLATIAGWNAREAGLSALRWNAETGETSLFCCVYAHAGEWEGSAAALAHAALLQIGDAERARSPLAEALAVAPPPPARAREEGDPLLEAWRTYAAAGASGAPGEAWDADALLAHAESTQPPPWLRVRRDAAGLHAELAAPLAGAPEAGSAPGAGVALLRLVAAQPHPRLGAGLLAVLEPPAGAEPLAARYAATAALLNEGEAREWTGCDALGAWCVHPARGLVFVSFLPRLACRPESGVGIAWQMALRARWSARFLAEVARRREAASPGA